MKNSGPAPPAASPATETRRRRPRGSLTVEGIVDAAEQVATGGAEDLTVRAVAARLQASPMALYRYFATMDALIDALLDRVLGRFESAPPTDDWVEDLRVFARTHRTVLTEHPWAITLLFTHPNPGLNAVRIGEAALQILRRGGIDGGAAVATFSGILSLNYGWSAFATAREYLAPGGGEPSPSMRDVLMALPADQFPLTVGVAGQMANYGGDDHYDRVLDQLLVGVRADAG